MERVYPFLLHSLGVPFIIAPLCAARTQAPMKSSALIALGVIPLLFAGPCRAADTCESHANETACAGEKACVWHEDHCHFPANLQEFNYSFTTAKEFNDVYEISWHKVLVDSHARLEEKADQTNSDINAAWLVLCGETRADPCRPVPAICSFRISPARGACMHSGLE